MFQSDDESQKKLFFLFLHLNPKTIVIFCVEVDRYSVCITADIRNVCGSAQINSESFWYFLHTAVDNVSIVQWKMAWRRCTFRWTCTAINASLFHTTSLSDPAERIAIDSITFSYALLSGHCGRNSVTILVYQVSRKSLPKEMNANATANHTKYFILSRNLSCDSRISVKCRQRICWYKKEDIQTIGRVWSYRFIAFHVISAP